MIRNRIVLHIFFWVLYFSITLFSKLFLLSDEVDDFNEALRTFTSEFILLCLKIGFTYTIFLSAALVKKPEKMRETTLIILAILIFEIIFRMTIQCVCWPYILHETNQLSFKSQLARFLYSLLEILQIVRIAVAIKLMRLRIESSILEKAYIKEKMSVELVRLKAQIHPHFLFNMLNTVYYFSKSNPGQTTEVILKMSELLRFMLYESEKRLITLESKVNIIKMYIELQQLRFDNKVKVDTPILRNSLIFYIKIIDFYPAKKIKNT